MRRPVTPERATLSEHPRALRSKVRLRKFGAATKRIAIIPPMETLDVDPSSLTPLPEGYTYTDPGSVDAERLQRLFRDKIGWSSATRKHFREQGIRHGLHGVNVANVAIKQEDGHLAGFGTMLHKGTAGKLCNLGVDPRDRNNGLGKALILERVRLAEVAGVTSLEIPYLEDTNSLKEFYFQLGFSELPNGALVRGTDKEVFDSIADEHNPALDAAHYVIPQQEE